MEAGCPPRRLLLGGRQRVDIGDDQRAGALVGEDFAEDAFRCTVGNDMHAADAAANRVLDGRGLGQHAVQDPPRLAQPLQAGKIGVGDQRARILGPLEDAGRAGAQDQLLRAERRAERCGDRIGIDVEQHAASRPPTAG